MSLLVVLAASLLSSHAVNGEVKKIPGTASIRIVEFDGSIDRIGTHLTAEQTHRGRAARDPRLLRVGLQIQRGSPLLHRPSERSLDPFLSL